MDKKWIFILLFSILLIVIIFTVPIIEIVSDIYDVDGDDDIDIFDVQWIFQHIGEDDTTYDVDKDGDVDIFDVQSAFKNIGNEPQEFRTIVEWLVDFEWG